MDRFIIRPPPPSPPSPSFHNEGERGERERNNRIFSSSSSSSPSSSLSLSRPLFHSFVHDDSLLVVHSSNIPIPSSSPFSFSGLLCFDLDSTLIRPCSGRVFPKDEFDWIFLFDMSVMKDSIQKYLEKNENKNYLFVILTNQGGIEKGKSSVKKFTTKATNIMTQMMSKLNISHMVTLAATKEDKYRKPNIGMWNFLMERVVGSSSSSLPSPSLSPSSSSFSSFSPSSCLFIGDAAGRPTGWKVGRKKDFSCSDRKFAFNAKINFKTPEEFFLNEKESPFSWIEGGRGRGDAIDADQIKQFMELAEQNEKKTRLTDRNNNTNSNNNNDNNPNHNASITNIPMNLRVNEKRKAHEIDQNITDSPSEKNDNIHPPYPPSHITIHDSDSDNESRNRHDNDHGGDTHSYHKRVKSDHQGESSAEEKKKSKSPYGSSSAASSSLSHPLSIPINGYSSLSPSSSPSPSHANAASSPSPSLHSHYPFTPSPTQEFVLLVGSPSSGKSSFVHRVLLPHGYQWVNQDTLKTKEKCLSTCKTLLQQGKSVVVDNTNPSKDVRGLYLSIAKFLNCPCRIVHFDTPLSVCRHLNVVREKLTNGERKKLPPIAFHMFAKNFQAPEMSESPIIKEIVKIGFKPIFASEKEKEIFQQMA